jgi:hypothetical protein
MVEARAAIPSSDFGAPSSGIVSAPCGAVALMVWLWGRKESESPTNGRPGSRLRRVASGSEILPLY